MKLFLTSFLIIFSFSSYSQHIQFSGTIIDQGNKQPIPFVNIAIAGSYIGTISNSEGKFYLSIPEKYLGKKVNCSCIGFHSLEIELKPNMSNQLIELETASHAIDEIIIMPDSTLLTMIKMAYDKIEVNYPDFDTRSTGFYRETLKQENGEHLYLTEALLDVYKTSYTNKIEGQINVLKSRKYTKPGMDSINHIHFYGGPFFPHTLDKVKNRVKSIRPSSKLEYKLEGTVFLNNQELYVVAYRSKKDNVQHSKGKIYINKKSLAFERFEYNYTNENFDINDHGLLDKRVTKQTNTVVQYTCINSKYYLKAITFNQLYYNAHTRHMLEMNDEYVVTQIETKDVSSIPFNEQLNYTSVITDEAENYLDSEWKEYPTITDNINVNIHNSEFADSIYALSYIKQPLSKKDRFIKITTRFEAEFNINRQSIFTNPGQYDLVIGDNILLKTISFEDFLWNIETNIKYKLNKHWKLVYYTSERKFTEGKSMASGLGFSYSFPLKKMGRKIFLSLQTVAGYQQLLYDFGEHRNVEAFALKGKTFDTEKIQVNYGLKGYNLDNRIMLSCEINRIMSFQVFTGIHIDLGTKSIVKVKETSGFFLNRKSANVPTNQGIVNVTRNGQQFYNSELFSELPYFGVGLTFGFN